MNAIATTPDVLELPDPANGRVWRAPRRLLHSIHGQVRQRLLAGFMVPMAVVRALHMPAFLEPVSFRGSRAHLSACIIDMEHAAPDWAPNALAPACVGVALRVTCRDRRDHSPAVFVATRYCDSFLTPMIEFLGISGFRRGLEIVGDLNRDATITTADWQLTIQPGAPGIDTPVFSPPVFDALISAGITSYGSPTPKGTCCRIDLHKTANAPFQRHPAIRTSLHLAGATFHGDLRTSQGGTYIWHCLDAVVSP